MTKKISKQFHIMVASISNHVALQRAQNSKYIISSVWYILIATLYCFVKTFLFYFPLCYSDELQEPGLPVKDRIRMFESQENENKEDQSKPEKNKPTSKAYNFFETKGLIITQVCVQDN